METVNATELAKILDLSKGRITQLVHDGTLKGCFTGDGRQRRFNVMAAAEALGKKLDPGQRLGNGAASAAAVRKLMDDDATGEGDAPPEKLDASDPDRYQMARILKVEEEGRKLRRQNAEADGAYVLADAAGRAAARQLAAEIAGFETVIRDGARAIADELSVDFKTARTILLRTWRAHRKGRAETLESDAAAAVLADDEKAANI